MRKLWLFFDQLPIMKVLTCSKQHFGEKKGQHRGSYTCWTLEIWQALVVRRLKVRYPAVTPCAAVIVVALIVTNKFMKVILFLMLSKSKMSVRKNNGLKKVKRKWKGSWNNEVFVSLWFVLLVFIIRCLWFLLNVLCSNHVCILQGWGF